MFDVHQFLFRLDRQLFWSPIRGEHLISVICHLFSFLTLCAMPYALAVKFRQSAASAFISFLGLLPQKSNRFFAQD